jgi:integrase
MACRSTWFQIAADLLRCGFFQPVIEDTAIAKALNQERVPRLEQIWQVLANMTNGSDIEKRNRALTAFALLTGARDNAIASMRLKHIDLLEGKILQDARQVRTKFAKSFSSGLSFTQLSSSHLELKFDS